MDHFPPEVLERVLVFAVSATPDDVLPTPTHSSSFSRYNRKNKVDEEENSTRCNPTAMAMSSVAGWRCVNRQWKDVLDNPSSLVWYVLAKALDLEPPLQIFAGGTHQDVCKFLLKAEREKEETNESARNTKTYQIACGIGMLPQFFDEHPQPERPMVKFPEELSERLAANADALQNFLRSMDYSVLRSSPLWHRSAWNRYRMFLHLKLMNPGVWLVPTADIEFCWLAHIFRTESYWKDVKNLGLEPDHWLCLSYGEVATFSKAVESTKALWDKTFGPDLPFIPEGTETSWKIWRVECNAWGGSAKASRNDPRRFFPVLGPELLDIPAAVEQMLPAVNLSEAEIKADLVWFPELQNAFKELSRNSFEVMRGRDREKKLISQQVVPSYERFLNLCNRNKNLDLAPPYVLDLVWHAHQMEPVKYKEECLALFGREFLHNPWPHGLGVSYPISKEFECAWKQAYGTTMGDDWKFYLGNQRRSHIW